MVGAEEEQCAVQLVFTESSCGVTGKMGQNTKGDFVSESLRVVRHRNRLPRDVLELPSLELFKGLGDTVLRDMV